MNIGLCGAQRTGKSTLAKAYSVKSGMPFLQTEATQVFKDMGLDPKVDYPLSVRIDIQKRILEAFDKQYAACKEGFITDRTPLDMMAYMLADVTRQNTDPEQVSAIAGYIKDCEAVANTHFSTLIVVQPGIPLIEAEGKAPANLAYMEHISALVMGLVQSETLYCNHYFIPRYMTELALRLRCVETVAKRSLDRHLSWLTAQQETGAPVMFH